MSVLSTIQMIIWLLSEEKMSVTSNSTPQRQIAVMFSLERMLTHSHCFYNRRA